MKNQVLSNVQYNDCLHFVASECQSEKLLSFLWWTEREGHGHLFMVKAEISGNRPADSPSIIEDNFFAIVFNILVFIEGDGPQGPVIREEFQLTSGRWSVIRKIQVLECPM